MPATRSPRRRPVTPEDLRRLVGVGDPRISPDGASIVFVHKRASAAEPKRYETNLWRVPTDGGDAQPFTSGGRDSAPRFSPDGSIVAFVRSDPEGGQQVWTIPVDGGEARMLTRFDEGRIGALQWSPDGAHLAVSHRATVAERTAKAREARERDGRSEPPWVLDHWWYRLDGDGYFGGARFALHLVDAETGSARVLYAADTLGFFTFDFAPDGREVVVATNRHRRAGLDAWNDELLRIRVSDGRATPIPNLPDGPKHGPRWSPDGTTIAYAGREGRDSIYSPENLELWTCHATKGGARCLSGREDYCLMAVVLGDASEASFDPNFRWTPDGARLLVQIGWHGTAHVASIAKRGGAFTMHTRGAKLFDLGTISDDGRVAMVVSDATHPGEVCAATMRGAKAWTPKTLTSFNRELLSELALARPKATWLRSASGTKVQVWTMTPPGRTSARRGPAVLQIHGGPHAQYGVGFFHEFQVLAGAGYTVFYSNPRGSKGYGRDHCAAIRGAWGAADWEDVEAVIDQMQSSPHVDPKRMGIMGGSYGGYLTNWAIGHTNVFAGAITDRCVSNLVSMSGSSDFIDSPDLYWEGNWWDRPEARWDQSPLQYLGNCRTPTLIIHSEGDLRCNVEQGEQVFATLSQRGIPTRFVRYPRTTSHGLSRSGPPDLRIHRLEQILGWWGRWLKKSKR